MKKILSVLFIITLLACNDGGEEPCQCNPSRDEAPCDGTCDNCGSPARPTATKLLIAEKKQIKPLEMEYFGVRKISYDNGNTWTVKN